MTRINIPLDEELHRKARLASLLQESSLKEYITVAIEEKVKKDQKQLKGKVPS